MAEREPRLRPPPGDEQEDEGPRQQEPGLQQKRIDEERPRAAPRPRPPARAAARSR